jgi:hypothetical protein
MPVEYYKARKDYYYRKGPKGAKRISKQEYDEAVKGKPISRAKVMARKKKSHKKKTKRR